MGITISIKQYIALVLNIKVHMKSQHSQSGTKPAYLILFMVSFIYNDSSDSENQNISACNEEAEPMQSYQLQDCQYTRSRWKVVEKGSGG